MRDPHDSTTLCLPTTERTDVYRHTIILPTRVPGLPDDVTTAAHARLERALLARFGGFSATVIVGAWLDDDARIVRDESARYESLYAADCTTWLEHVACELADDLNQDCVLVTVETVDHVGFVAGTRESAR
jgi:hypothetical protein